MAEVKTPALPEGILKTDLKYPQGKNGGYVRVTGEFEIWHSERFGWIIPTLTIRQVPGRLRATGDRVRRSYAIALSDGGMVSAGLGPHVKVHQVEALGSKSKYSEYKKQQKPAQPAKPKTVNGKKIVTVGEWVVSHTETVEIFERVA